MAITHLAKWWIDKADKNPDPSALMDAAIKIYKAQKERFILQLQQAGLASANTFVEQMNAAMDAELAKEVSGQGTYGISEKIMDNVENAVYNIIETMTDEQRKDLNTIISDAKKRLRPAEGTTLNAHDEISRIAKNISDDIEQSLFGSSTQRAGIMQSIASQYHIQVTKTLSYQMLSLARRSAVAILSDRYGDNRNLMNKDIHFKRYVSTSKGYIAEQWWTSAANQILAPIDDRVKAFQTEPFSKIGKEGKADTMLVFGQGLVGHLDAGNVNVFNKLLDHMQIHATAQSSLQYEDIPKITGKSKAFGIQSKSWELSDAETDINKSNIWFGSSSDLIPYKTSAYIWHAGLFSVMHNLLQVIGPDNVLFATGKTMNWTANLLAELKKQEYVLAFRLSERHDPPKITSGEVYALPHNDPSNWGAYEKSK